MSPRSQSVKLSTRDELSFAKICDHVEGSGGFGLHEIIEIPLSKYAIKRSHLNRHRAIVGYKGWFMHDRNEWTIGRETQSVQFTTG